MFVPPFEIFDPDSSLERLYSEEENLDGVVVNTPAEEHSRNDTM